MRCELAAAESGIVQTETLYHCAHGSVEHEYLFVDGLEQFAGRGCVSDHINSFHYYIIYYYKYTENIR